MALHQNDIALGKEMMPEIDGSGLVAKRMVFDLDGDLAVNDIVELGFLLGGALPVDAIVDHPAMGASSTVSFGLLNAGKTDLEGTPWIAAADWAAAGAQRADDAGLRAMALVTASETNRSVGIKVVADSSATSGQIGVTFFYRAA